MSGSTSDGKSPRPLPARQPVPATSTESARADVDDRGTTTLADRVVEKIASRAALDIEHAGGLSRRVAGRTFGTRRVRASAEVDGQIVSLELELAVEYPASARATTRHVREHVRERVGTLCGLSVDHIDITVAVLRRADQERKRVQ